MIRVFKFQSSRAIFNIPARFAWTARLSNWRRLRGFKFIGEHKFSGGTC